LSTFGIGLDETRCEKPRGSAVRSPLGRDGANPMTRMAPGEGSVRSSVGWARNRLSLGDWFGQPVGNSSPVFGFLAPNQALRATENPRVDGSIDSDRHAPILALRAAALPSFASRIGPSLATISNSMIYNRFRVSPADYSGPLMADPRTIGPTVNRQVRFHVSPPR